MKLEAARVLYPSTMQLRTHWSGIIITFVGFMIAASVGIWSYFLKAYIDSASTEPVYIGIAALLTSLLAGLWRLYTHLIDNNIAGLYKELMECEEALSIDIEHGTSGYLMRNVPNTKIILQDDQDDQLSRGQKIVGISKLVESKRIGRRGHKWFDRVTLFLIITMLFGSIYAFGNEPQWLEAILCYIGIIIGYILTLIGYKCYHQDPSKEEVIKIKASLQDK